MDDDHFCLPVLPGTDAETVRLTHGQLAGLIGATRERTTTVLGELAERGLVGRIRDWAGLAAVADGAASAPGQPGAPTRKFPQP
jgi:CRP/FNR family transcriptional regulator, cyclic AMP receptor protein